MAARRRRTRRPRLFPELPAGAPVPHGEGFMSLSGQVTRDRRYVEFLRWALRYEAQHTDVDPFLRARFPRPTFTDRMVMDPSLRKVVPDPFIAFECPRGLIPIQLMAHKGHLVPLCVNPEL
jgi:hypothetical protein